MVAPQPEPVALDPILAAIADIAQSDASFASSATGLCNLLLASGADHIALVRRALDSGHVDGAVSDGLNRHDLLAVHAAIEGSQATAVPRQTREIGPTYIPGVGHFQVHLCQLELDHESFTALVALVAVEQPAFAQAAFDGSTLAATMMLRQSMALEIQRHQQQERATIARLTRSVVTMQGLETVFTEVVNSVRAMTGWDSCAIGVHHNHPDTLDIEIQSDHATATSINPWGARIDMLKWNGLRFACENCTPYRMAIDLPESLTAFEAGEMTRLGLHSILAVPVVLESEPVGMILVASASARRLDPAVLRTIEELGTTTALAVQHHRFVEQARLQAEEQTALIRVSQAVISGRDLSAILTEIARVCLQFDGVEGARVLLWQKEHDQFEIAAVQHMRDWQMYYRRGDRYPAADWPSVKAVLQSKVSRGLLTADSEVNARERYNHAADHIQSFHSFPIIVDDFAVGVLSFLSRDSRRMPLNTIRVGQEMASQAAHAIDRANLFGQLRQRAETDGLTGLLNHRAAFETLDRELAVSRRQRESVSIIVLDLDDFKYFNDTHGHLIGDRILTEVAGALREIARPRDYVARHGGDEFLLVLPDTDRNTASRVATRVLQRIDEISIEIGELSLPIRTSVGIATAPGDACNRQELVAYADAAMYAAKEMGGGQLGAIDKSTRSLEVTVFGALAGLVRAVDRKDRYTKDHSDLVAEYAVRFGRYLQLDADQIEALDVAGQLHDVGKIAVPDSVLRKPGHLNPEEEALIRQHVVFSEMIIKGIPNLDFVVDAVANHHERWDGSGYPYRRAGEEIPLMGRILALSDALAAMTHNRPYRRARTLEAAVVEIRRGTGSQFDPNLVEPFIAAVTTGSALLREVNRRRHFQTSDIETGNIAPIGLTDYLRERAERHQSGALANG